MANRGDASPEVIEALTAVVREQRAALAALARREGLGPEDALDCVHDALCVFVEKALEDELPGDRGEWLPLLAGTVVNHARNKRRRHHLAVRHLPLDDLGVAEDQVPVDELVARAEECVRLKGCLRRLCQSQRTVVMLRLLEERPGEDVAAALGLTRAHVDVLLYRAKASLRVCMLGDAG